MNIPTGILKAALTHAPKKDIRYYMNGVLIDMGSGRVVATDGSRLFVARIPYASIIGSSFIIPRETLEIALKMHGKQSEIAVSSSAVGSVSFTPIDGKFPDYERCIPRGDRSGIVAAVNPQYMLDAQKALCIVAKDRSDFFKSDVSYNGPNDPVLVTQEGIEALVVVMPMRRDAADYSVSARVSDVLRPATLPSIEAAA